MGAPTKQRTEDIETIVKEFRSFRKSGLVFSSHHKRLIDRYPDEWVAIHNGQVRAHDSDYDAVLSKIDAIGIPRNLVLVRYIAKKPCSMIL